MSTAPTGEDWHDLVDLRSPTEDRNPRSGDIDLLGTTELVRLICAEDRVVVDAVAAVTDAVAAVVDLAVAAIRAGGRVHYVGSGTSGRLGVLDAVELLPTFGVGDEWFVAHLAGGAGAMMQAVEGAEDDRALGGHDAAGVRAGDLVFGIAASGRTPYVAGALAAGRSRGARTALLSANPHAVLAAEVDVAVLVDTGPEVVTGSTRMKAATAQKMVLNTFSTATLVRLGRTYSNLMIDVRATNAKLRARTVRMLVQATALDAARCEAMLDAADQEVRTSLVALLAGTDPATARAALVVAADPARDHDRSGVRTAVAALTEDAVPEDAVPGPAGRSGARVGCAHAEAPPRGPVR